MFGNARGKVSLSDIVWAQLTLIMPYVFYIIETVAQNSEPKNVVCFVLAKTKHTTFLGSLF